VAPGFKDERRDMPVKPSTAAASRQDRFINAAIVGGGKGCASVLKMVKDDTLGRFRLRVQGVADVDPQAPGLRYAREIGIPLVTTDYLELYEIPDLDLIIELTGKHEMRDEIERTRPRHIRLIDHFGARLFWELHQAEEAVIRQRTEMRERVEAERVRVVQILNSIPDEMLVLDSEMVIQDANTAFLHNNNLTINEVRGRHCYEIDQRVRGECQVAVGNCPFFSVIKEGRPTSLVRKHFGPDGMVLYAVIVGAPLLDAEGRVLGMIEMTRDITKRIRLEEDLKATEVQLKQFMAQAPLATYVKNRAGQYIDVNPAACEMFNKKASEILGKTDYEIFDRQAAEKMRSGDREAWQERFAVPVDVEVQLGGRRVFLSTVKFPIVDHDGKPTALCGLTTDITAQKEAEIKLNETREYLQKIMDNSPVIIVTTDLEGNVVSFNRGAEESLGYSAAEAIGKPAAMFYQDPSKRDEFLRLVKSGKAVKDYSYELLRKDGTLLPVSITLSQLKDAGGNMIGTVGMSKDISRRKALMGQMLQSERMAAVGRVASGVAHEINNPLAVIGEIAGFFSSLIEDDAGTGEAELRRELSEGLPKILKQVKRVRDITQRLLTFARKTEARVDVADVNGSLDEILPFLQKEAHLAQATIHRDYQENLPRVAVEEMQLQEVFINLINNAVHAVAKKNGGNVWLTTREEGGKVVVVVKDDGPGIDETVRDRLFEPFVTTKTVGEGTGLGLSICYGIVKRYDGEIRVHSEPGRGATFTVILPAHIPASQPPD
jgi:PAS domain S-box-containing protein